MLFVNINSSFLTSLYIMGIVAINKMISSNEKVYFYFLLLGMDGFSEADQFF